MIDGCIDDVQMDVQMMYRLCIDGCIDDVYMDVQMDAQMMYR